MKKYLSKLIFNEEGSGLILALMTLMVLAVLGASLGAITIGSHRLGAVNRDDTSAYYIAEAGANQMFEEVKGHVYDAHDSTSGQSSFFNRVDELSNPYFEGQSIKDFSSQFGDSPESLVTLSRVKEEGETVSYELQSLGRVDGRERKVIKAFDVTYVSESIGDIEFLAPENAAIVSNSRVDLSNNSNVYGDIIVENSDNVTSSKDNQIFGEVIAPINNWDGYNKSISIPNYDKFGELESDEVNTNNGEIYYYKTNELDLSNLSINGNGIVNILVTDSMVSSNNGFFGNIEAPDKVRIFYLGHSKIEIANNFQLNASLFIEKSNIEFGNNVIFNGVFYYKSEKDLNVNNNVEINSYFLAPNAKIMLSNNAVIIGSIVAGEIELSNNSEVRYKKVSSYPFYFENNEKAEEVDLGELITSRPVIEPK